MASPEYETELQELRGNITCGGIQLNLDKLTFSLTCIYCDLELTNLKKFAHHFQEHLVMSDAEHELLLKNVEYFCETNDAMVDEKSSLVDNECQDMGEKDYEIEMLDDTAEGNLEFLSNNDNTDNQFVYQVNVLGSEVDEAQLDYEQQQKNIETHEMEDDGTLDLGFDLVPDDTSILNSIKNNKKDGYSCDICGIKFTEASILVTHRQRHNRCHLCKINFPSKAQLKAHIKVHALQKLFVCEECGRSFDNSNQFQIHQRRHIYEPLHLCNTCGKSFQDELTLTEHIKTHTTARPFVCMECNMTFSRQKALMLHASMHTEVRKFSCTICRMTFAQNSGLIAHIKDKHRNTFDDSDD